MNLVIRTLGILIAACTVWATEKTNIEAAYADLPLSFEANRGQADPAVRFLARGVALTSSRQQ